MRPGPLPQVAPCIVTHNLALGGAQTAVLRLIRCLPDWVRERTTLYSQSQDVPLLEAAIAKHGFSVAAITHQPPADPSCWVLSYGDLRGLSQRPVSLLLHSWDDEGWRYITKTYYGLRDVTVAGVSQQVLRRFDPWIRERGHRVAGVLPPPVTEYCVARGASSPRNITVAWMGRPLESKGLLSLPHLLRLDPRLIVRAWTGADTGGLAYTRQKQSETMENLLKLATKLKVLDRLDLRPLDFDPFAYRHRLDGCHVLLGNSRREGFLMTAAEALSCGIPAVVTRDCGVAELIRDGENGALIDWNEDPKRLARASYQGILRAVECDSLTCLGSVADLSLGARYRQTYGDALARITHSSLRCPEAEARVTVGVRIHHPMRVDHLDIAISSLALQTYRRFKTVLLVDGPRQWGEMLARRYDLPLICTGVPSDITHCSGLHREALEQCDTEFYKPLDYDDQLLPEYLERAVRVLDTRGDDVYGCLLLTLEGEECSPRRWPHRPLSTMFTGNPDDNMLPHSSVLMRAQVARDAGNYQERAVGLGADDYHLWNRIHRHGGRFFRDDDVRNVIYRIHEKNSLKIRRQRYGSAASIAPRVSGGLIAGATAASIALLLSPGPASGGVQMPEAPAYLDRSAAPSPTTESNATSGSQKIYSPTESHTRQRKDQPFDIANLPPAPEKIPPPHS